MKYVLKAPPNPFTLDALVLWLVSEDARFNRSGPGIRMGMHIENACERCKEQPYLELKDDQHAALVAAAEEPTCGYPPLQITRDGKTTTTASARTWLAHIDAIRDAKDDPL